MVAAPHPVSRRLFEDIGALLAELSPGQRPVSLTLATCAEDADQIPHELLVYLRNECSSACRIAATLAGSEQPRLRPAAALLTRLEGRYWEHPNLTVEAALRDPPYLLARLGELLGRDFGATVLELTRKQFVARAAEAERYCDPLGFLEAVELPPNLEPASPPGPVPDGTLLERTLKASGIEALTVVADDAAAGRRQLEEALGAPFNFPVISVDQALEGLAGLAPQVACLIEVVDAPRVAELVEQLQAAHWLLCGAERSGEAVAELRSHFVNRGVDLKTTYVVEGRSWKALPYGLFEG